MSEDKRMCQSCKQVFRIDPEDFAFYERMNVPPPTWCAECRMIRRWSFYNQHKLFRRDDDATGQEVVSGIPPQAPFTVYNHDYWWSDSWDPMKYGREYDFSRPFFEQFKELMRAVPVPARSFVNMIDSDYANNASDCRNAYLSFDINQTENSAYIIMGQSVKESFDLYEARHTEMSYEGYMVDEGYKVFYSVNCEESTDIWFSRNLFGCSNCFGCVNLRNKSYHIFNKPASKEEYQKFVAEFQSGSFEAVQEMRKKAEEFWAKYPMRFALVINCENSSGEHIERSKNLKYCYSAHEAENLAYSQLIWPPMTDAYDSSSVGIGGSRFYEVANSGFHESYNLKFCWECWSSTSDIEYSIDCHSSSNLFGCVGLKKKQYCIFNKQYSKEDYFKLREEIVLHMNKMQYTDGKGRMYSYGEFFPPEFSPFAYNETIAQDFFPLTQDEALQKGYAWHEPEKREYQTTLDSATLPDNIKDVPDSVVNELIKCAGCKKAYRVIRMELDFLHRVNLPLPRMCPDCRFRDRMRFVNAPRWRHAKCQCAGDRDDRNTYVNNGGHPHGAGHCPNQFETAYAHEKQDILYCAECYQAEVI